ncbi:MAG: DUF302 domain-containing protein [Betaproteobacteria bacterium]|nr:DUF302 domain-containing protein [Betaproteobacteria bacterium]
MNRIAFLLFSFWAAAASAQQPTPEQMKQMHEAATRQFQLMGAMFHVRRAKLGFEETVAAIRDGAGKRGWSVGGVQDVQSTLQQQGVKDARRMKVVFLCIKDANERLAKVYGGKAPGLPCRATVFEDKEGVIHLLRMNTSAMARLTVGEGAKELARILAEIGAEEDALYKGLTKD